MVDFLKKEVNLSFDEAVGRIVTLAEENDFGILLVKDIDKIFKKKLGIESPRYTLVLACKADFAKAALDVSLDMGLLFPCSFVVYEENGKIIVGHISIMKIGPEIGLTPKEEMKPVIEMTGKGVRKIWDAI